MEIKADTGEVREWSSRQTQVEEVQVKAVEEVQVTGYALRGRKYKLFRACSGDAGHNSHRWRQRVEVMQDGVVVNGRCRPHKQMPDGMRTR